MPCSLQRYMIGIKRYPGIVNEIGALLKTELALIGIDNQVKDKLTLEILRLIGLKNRNPASDDIPPKHYPPQFLALLWNTQFYNIKLIYAVKINLLLFLSTSFIRAHAKNRERPALFCYICYNRE